MTGQAPTTIQCRRLPGVVFALLLLTVCGRADQDEEAGSVTTFIKLHSSGQHPAAAVLLQKNPGILLVHGGGRIEQLLAESRDPQQTVRQIIAAMDFAVQQIGEDASEANGFRAVRELLSGRLAFRQEQKELAIQHLDEALRLTENSLYEVSDIRARAFLSRARAASSASSKRTYAELGLEVSGKLRDPDPELYFDLQRVRSAAYFALGDFSESRRVLEDGLATIQAANSSDPFNEAICKFELARIAFRLRQLKRSRALATNAMTVARILGTDQGEIEAGTLLAQVETESGNYEEAARLYRRVISVAQKTLDARFRSSVPQLQIELGKVLILQKDTTSATRILQSAIHELENRNSADANSFKLARYYLLCTQSNTCDQLFFEKLRDIFDDSAEGDEKQPFVRFANHIIADAAVIALVPGSHNFALDSLKKATDWATLESDALSDSELLYFSKINQNARNRVLFTLPDDPQLRLNALESVLLSESLGSRMLKIRRSHRKSLPEKEFVDYRDLLRQRSLLQKNVSPASSVDQVAAEELNIRINQMERQFAAPLDRTQDNQPVQEIFRAMPEDSCFLYVTSCELDPDMVLPPGSTPTPTIFCAIAVFPFEDGIRTEVLRFQCSNELQTSLENPVDSSFHIVWRGLRRKAKAETTATVNDHPVDERQLWEKLWPLVKGHQKVYIMPRGIAAGIAWNSLYRRTETGIHWASEDSQFLLINDIQELGHIPRSAPEVSSDNSNKGLLTLSYASFGSETNWPRLPGSLAESESLAESWKRHFGTPVLQVTEDAASAKRLLAELPNYSVVHLATHFDVDLESLEESGWGTDSPFQGPRMIFAPDSTESGQASKLSAVELLSLPDLETRLLILSGCQSLNGQNCPGEGFLGVQRTFDVLGVRQILSSYWNVEDEAARKLVSNFFEHYCSNGGDAASALQKAQTELLRSEASPEVAARRYGGWIVSGIGESMRSLP